MILVMVGRGAVPLYLGETRTKLSRVQLSIITDRRGIVVSILCGVCISRHLGVKWANMTLIDGEEFMTSKTSVGGRAREAGTLVWLTSEAF